MPSDEALAHQARRTPGNELDLLRRPLSAAVERTEGASGR
jgi:hypothetical protein